MVWIPHATHEGMNVHDLGPDASGTEPYVYVLDAQTGRFVYGAWFTDGR